LLEIVKINSDLSDGIEFEQFVRRFGVIDHAGRFAGQLPDHLWRVRPVELDAHQEPLGGT
jgi:hypothetical protein